MRTLFVVPAASVLLWVHAGPVSAQPDEDRCLCMETAPAVVVTCEPGGPVQLKARHGDLLVDLTPEQTADALLAFEVWDGTRYQDMRCNEQGRPVTTSSGRPTPGVEGGVYRLFNRLYPRHTTSLRLLGPDPVVIGRHGSRSSFAGSARICAGPPAVVILPIDTVRQAVKIGGAALLAFIMGHELGHRSSAFTPEGDHCFVWAQESSDLDLDRLADARGAFYAAMAGYSMARFAEKREVHTVLANFRLDENARDERARALDQAFKDFDTYVGIYQTAIVLIFSGNLADAVTLLEWLHEMMDTKDVMVPEAKVALALALMMRAGPDGPWLEGMPRGMSRFACVPVYPERPAMSEEMGNPGLFGGLRGPGGRTREDAVEDLKKALRFLGEAADLGVSPLFVSAAKACANLYLGRDSEARREQKTAEGLVDRHAPETVRKTLAANRDLIQFHARVARAKRAPNWSKEARRIRSNQMLAGFVRCLGSARTDCGRTEAAGTCAGPRDTGDLGGFRLMEVPWFPAWVGQCPDGWSRRFSFPDPRVAEERQSVYGVTACVPEQGGTGKTVAVHVRLMGSTRPPAEEADFVVLMTSGLPEGARTLDAWSAACEVCTRGVSDLGDEAVTVNCRRVGVPAGVLFVEPGGRVWVLGVVR